ncbi:M4 family metallopeptidase [Microvirga sp. KLBC 81]|uniref:M4 family metallopeptidase n=1 Tax=Microvirga sp. KLBC 81 TaxID=1862707 RepID=UPI001FDFEFE6|nr:M4 family metallopeptidase [Microvirga sp. KLBC 81]
MADTATDPQLQAAASQALFERKAVQQTRNFWASQAAQPPAAPAAGAAPSPTKNRQIWDCETTLNLQFKHVRSEGEDPTGDEDVNAAYDLSGETWDFYQKVFGRNSIDGRGMDLISAVNYRNNYNNAFWNGEQMTYGDGDNKLFAKFVHFVDVVGHELTHGVIQFSPANLRYQAQSGALNESIADVFGSLIKQRMNGQTAEQADWLLGKGLLVPKEGAVRTALRSMKDPGTAYDDPTPNGLGKDPQPKDMDGYVELPIDDDNDWGGVHIYSGIPNRAFYLTAVELGGNAWDRAGKIWYGVLTGGRLGRDATFSEMRALTVDYARQHFDENVARVVSAAWDEVKVEAPSA